MSRLTQEQAEEITTAKEFDTAQNLLFKYCGSAYGGRIEYIKAMRGPRACGGFFIPTNANVLAKFLRVWYEERAARGLDITRTLPTNY